MRLLALLLVAGSFAVTATAAKHRTVTFWYVPDAYGGGDIDAVVSLMTQHNDTVTNVILECGHSINSSSPLGMNCADACLKINTSTGLTGSCPKTPYFTKCKFAGDTCLQTIKGFSAAGIKTELLVGGPDGAGSGS